MPSPANMVGPNGPVAPGTPGTITIGRPAQTPPPPPPSSSTADSNVPAVVPPPIEEREVEPTLAGVGGPVHRTIPKITGIGNQMMPFGVIPRVYGTMRMNPPLAGRFVSVTQGGINFGLGLFCVGYGEVVISDIRIGDKPIDRLPGVIYQVLSGTGSDLDIKPAIFSNDVKQFNHNAALKFGKPITKTPNKLASTISVDIAFPNGLYQADALGNKSPTTVNVDVFYRLNGSSMSVLRTATNDPAAGDNVDILITNTTGIAVGDWVTVRQPNQYSELCYVSNVVVNTSITVATLRNTYNNPTVRNEAWTKVLTGTATQPTIAITENATFVVTKTVEFDTPSFGKYDIQLVRTTAESTSSALVNATNWKQTIVFGQTPQVVAPVDAAGDEVPISYIAVKFRASDMVNGQLQNLNCLVQSKLSAYSSGTWQAPAVTSNPAWILADILTGTANARPLSKTLLDGATLAEFAAFCDANGRQFNYVFDQKTTYTIAAQQVAAVGRGVWIWKDGVFTVAWDTVRTTVAQHFTPLNTANFVRRRSWTKIPHAYRVTFNNAAADYVQDQRIVYADGYNADGSDGKLPATEFETINAPGITSADQAWREGRYRYGVAKERRNVYEIDTDFEALRCNRFDLVRIAHDVAQYGLQQGRIRSVTLDGSGHATSITLDEIIQMDAAATYGVRIRLNDGDSLTAPVVNSGLHSTTLTFVNPITSSTQPGVGDLVMFGILDAESIPALVKSIESDIDLGHHLTLVDYAPQIFEAESGEIPAAENLSTYQPLVQVKVPLPIVIGWQSDETVMTRDADGSYVTRIQLTLEPPDASVKEYETEVRTSGTSPWIPVGKHSVEPNVVYIAPLQSGVAYDVRIRARRYDDQPSEWNYILTNYTVIGDTTLPPDVPIFIVLTTGDDRVGWQYDSSVGVTVPYDFAGMQIRKHNGYNVDYDSAEIIAPLVVASNQFDVSQLGTGQMTLMIKAVDVSGNQSQNARVLLRNFGDQIVKNVLVETPEAPDFLGTLTGGTVIAGVATSDTVTAPLWTGGAMWTNPTGPLWSAGVGAMSYQWSHVPSPALFPPDAQLPTIRLVLDVIAERWSILYKLNSQSPLWPPGGSNQALWPFDLTSLLWNPSQPWALWPGSLPASVQEYLFKIECAASYRLTSEISEATTVDDVIDVVERLNNVAVVAAGTRLPIVKTYRNIVNVNLTARWPSGGGYTFPAQVVVIDYDPTGPLVKMFDIAGNPIDGVLDATVQGY